jgi:quinohemoprotein ethanol dehydrogenase
MTSSLLALLLTMPMLHPAVQTGRGASDQSRSMMVTVARQDQVKVDANDWPDYGRDPEGTHFSPLDQIRADNVEELQLAWSYSIESGPWRLESTPLMSGGIVYATGPWSEVIALDALNGQLLWRWDPSVIRYGAGSGGPNLCCGPVNRGVAIHEGVVFVGILDGRLVGLGRPDGRSRVEPQYHPHGRQVQHHRGAARREGARGHR